MLFFAHIYCSLWIESAVYPEEFSAFFTDNVNAGKQSDVTIQPECVKYKKQKCDAL